MEALERESPTLISEVIRALWHRGVTTAFTSSVPGDHALALCDAFERSDIKLVCTANEEGAAAAAFAYARARGLAVVLVDNASSMKVLDCLSQLGYAEHAPILVISGTPGVEEIAAHGPQLPWSQNSQMPTDIPLRMFKQVSVGCARLDQARRVSSDVNGVLQAMRRDARPGYLEIPSDLVHMALPLGSPNGNRGTLRSWSDATQNGHNPEVRKHEAGVCEEVTRWLVGCARPVCVVGPEVLRCGLRPALKRMLVALDLPFTTTLAAKGALSEMHPLFVGGVYAGSLSAPAVRTRVEGADGVLLLGVGRREINLEGVLWTCSGLREEACAWVDLQQGVVSHRLGSHPQVDLVAFLNTLDAMIAAESDLAKHCARSERPAATVLSTPTVLCDDGEEAFDRAARATARSRAKRPPSFAPLPQGLRLPRALAAVDAALTGASIVVADDRSALHAAALALKPHCADSFLAGAWGAQGYALGAALGAWCANTVSRPVVLMGDGALLAATSELATLARYKVPACVLVMQTAAESVRRQMVEGPFHDVPTVDHAALARALGFQHANQVEDEPALWQALQECVGRLEGPCLVSVALPNEATCREHARLGAQMRAVINGTNGEVGTLRSRLARLLSLENPFGGADGANKLGDGEPDDAEYAEASVATAFGYSLNSIAASLVC